MNIELLLTKCEIIIFFFAKWHTCLGIKIKIFFDFAKV